MADVTDRQVTNALRLLANVADDKAAKFDEMSDDISETDSDDDHESVTSDYDSF